jgi:hypothetical protein
MHKNIIKVRFTLVFYQSEAREKWAHVVALVIATRVCTAAAAAVVAIDG